MKPLLSICIPSYNRSSVLQRLVEQLIGMTSNRLEFIICDDFSTEAGIRTYLTGLTQRDNRVKVYFNKINLGITRNYYRCLQLAAGKYVMLLSNEDLLAANFAELVLPILDVTELDMLISIAGYQQDPNHNYFQRNPAATTTCFATLQHRFPHYIFRTHISGNIYNKAVLDFSLLSDLHLENPHMFPVVPLTLMGLRKQNFLLLNQVLVLTTISRPLYASASNLNWHEQLSPSTQLYLFKRFIQRIICLPEHQMYYEILAQSFQYSIFYKKTNGMKNLKHIVNIYFDAELAPAFRKGNWLALSGRFFWGCFLKYTRLHQVIKGNGWAFIPLKSRAYQDL